MFRRREDGKPNFPSSNDNARKFSLLSWTNVRCLCTYRISSSAVLHTSLGVLIHTEYLNTHFILRHTSTYYRWMDRDNKTVSDWTHFPQYSDLLVTTSPSLPLKCTLLLWLAGIWHILQWIVLGINITNLCDSYIVKIYKSALFMDMSLIQGCPYREVPLYTYMLHYNSIKGHND